MFYAGTNPCPRNEREPGFILCHWVVGIIVYFLTCGNGAAEGYEPFADPTPPGTIEYVNPDIPDFPDPEYPGDYYDTMAPATLDLAERARLSVNALTGMLNPNMDWEMYTSVYHYHDPPFMAHSSGDLATMGKYLEVIPLVRQMCGSPQNMEAERGLMEVFLKQQGEDGLIYLPLPGRPWVLPPVMQPNSGLPGRNDGVNQVSLLGYGNTRSMIGFLIYGQKYPRGPFHEAAQRMCEGFKRTIIEDGDIAYTFSSWMKPGRAIVKPEHPPRGILGGMIAWLATAMVSFDQAMDDPESTELAMKLIRYSMGDLNYYDENGRFMPDGPGVGGGPYAEKSAHFYTHVKNITAALYVIERTGDLELLDRAVKAYDWAKQAGDDKLGYFPVVTTDVPGGFFTSETCEVSDMILAAVKFSRLGIDRWDDADRWLRNQLAENQLTDISWLQDGSLDFSKTTANIDSFDKGLVTTDRVAERTVGAFCGWPGVNDWVSQDDWGTGQHLGMTIMNCCSGSGARGLYIVWRDMVEYKEGRLRVNLLLNRASKWADIDSFIPYTGRVDVKTKRKLKNLEIRIPQWVKPEEVSCEVDGSPRELKFVARYAIVGKVKKGQVCTLKFPIFERTDTINVQGQDYTIVRRGNTVVKIDPPGKYHPFYQRAHYRNEKPLYRKVRRFVSDEDFGWW